MRLSYWWVNPCSSKHKKYPTIPNIASGLKKLNWEQCALTHVYFHSPCSSLGPVEGCLRIYVLRMLYLWYTHELCEFVLSLYLYRHHMPSPPNDTSTLFSKSNRLVDSRCISFTPKLGIHRARVIIRNVHWVSLTRQFKYFGKKKYFNIIDYHKYLRSKINILGSLHK